MATFLGFLLFVSIFLSILIYTLFSWGVVTYFYYYWFLMPIFDFLPHITFFEAVSIQLVFLLMNRVTFFNKQTINSLKEPNNQEALSTLIGPWFTLLIAWLFKIIFL